MDDATRRLKDEGSSVGYASGRELDADTERKTREIRSDIARTREDMSETIDAIQGKLRPANVVAEATDRVKAAATERVSVMADSVSRTAHQAMEETRRTAGHVADGVRQNAIPLALIGIGAGWLFANRQGNGQLNNREANSREWDGRGLWQRNRSETAGFYGESNGDVANRFQHLLQSNPLMVGAAGLAIGAAVGLLLPETERENEWLGEARENLVDRAQDAVRTAATQVREAAGDLAGQVANQVVSGKEGTE